MKRIVRFAPLIVLLVFVGAALLYSESLKTRVRVGATVPSFELPTLAGDDVRLDDFRGQPVFINFWAAWCPPCLEEMPAHDEFFRRYGDRMAYLAVNERETVARIERHLNEVRAEGLTMTLPILLDRRGAVGDTFRLGGMPETWVIDADGVARQHWVGPITFEQLQAGYYEATGEHIDDRDGGPFHGPGAARAILVVPGTNGGISELFVGGEGGLARYDMTVGGAAASDFTLEAVAGDTVLVLGRTADSDGPTVVTERGLPGLPDAPTAVASDGEGNELAWVPRYGLYGRRADDEWRPISSGLSPQMPWAALDADPFVPDRWLLASAGGLWESRDGGQSWRSTGMSVRTYAVRHDPISPRRVYLATDTGVWLSEDGGRTAARIPGSPQRVLVALDAIVTRHDGAMYEVGAMGESGTAGDVVGAGRLEIASGTGTAGDVHTAGSVTTPDDVSTVLAAVAPNGDVYTSGDAGVSWKLVVPVNAGTVNRE